MQDFYLISVLSLRKVFNYDMLSHTLTLPICELHQPRHKVGHAYRIFILTYNIFLLHSNLTKYLASLMGFGTRFYRQRFPFWGHPAYIVVMSIRVVVGSLVRFRAHKGFVDYLNGLDLFNRPGICHIL